MHEFKDATALVTGGAQGIGRAVADAFLHQGARVVLLDHDAEALREAEQALFRTGQVLPVLTDVSDEAAVAAAVGQAVDRFGGLDVLVNNAGIFISRPLTELSLADWNRVIGVNLTGMFLLAKHCAPHLRERRGAVVNIASTRAYQSEPGTEAYAASKGGVVALTHALAMSLGPDVRVNAVAPGWIDVTGLKKSGTEPAPPLKEIDHAQHPAGRVGRPEDVARAVLFLASPHNGFATGACLVLDGGMTRKMIYAE